MTEPPPSPQADTTGPIEPIPKPDLEALRQAALTALEHSSETIDLALTQGQPQGAETTLWFRLQNVCEYIGYIAEVIRVVSVAYPHDAQQTQAGADLVVAVETSYRASLTSGRADYGLGGNRCRPTSCWLDSGMSVNTPRSSNTSLTVWIAPLNAGRQTGASRPPNCSWSCIGQSGGSVRSTWPRPMPPFP